VRFSGASRAERRSIEMTRKSVWALLLGVAVLAGGCQKKEAVPAAAASPAAMSEDEKAVYALGAAIGQQAAQSVKALNLSPAELEVLKKGLAASLAGEKPQYDIQQYGPKLQARAEAQATTAAAGEKQKSAAFRDTAAAEAGAVKTASGLVFKTITPGSGGSPKATDTVSVHYHGTLPDGKVFDSSVQRGQPAEFQLNQVIPCWTEGVQRMKVGEKAKLVCPSEIAYGDRGAGPDIGPGATLVFEVELLAIKGK
jgi:FKBP-type peptidyl-prolyl cis-trans isomerase FkpA